MASLERQLKALANKRRLAIVKFLDIQNEASVGDVSEYIKLSFKATSKHLAVLSAADMLDKEQRSKTVFYKLASPKPSLLKHTLSLI